jgi:hypothetical protein
MEAREDCFSFQKTQLIEFSFAFGGFRKSAGNLSSLVARQGRHYCWAQSHLTKNQGSASNAPEFGGPQRLHPDL